jgi:hypothetical protein
VQFGVDNLVLRRYFGLDSRQACVTLELGVDYRQAILKKPDRDWMSLSRNEQPGGNARSWSERNDRSTKVSLMSSSDTYCQCCVAVQARLPTSQGKTSSDCHMWQNDVTENWQQAVTAQHIPKVVNDRRLKYTMKHTKVRYNCFFVNTEISIHNFYSHVTVYLVYNFLKRDINNSMVGVPGVVRCRMCSNSVFTCLSALNITYIVVLTVSLNL